MDSDQVAGRPSYLVTDSLKDSHREFWTVAHSQAVHPTLIAPGLDPTHLDSGIPESNQHVRDTTMPWGVITVRWQSLTSIASIDDPCGRSNPSAISACG